MWHFQKGALPSLKTIPRLFVLKNSMLLINWTKMTNFQRKPRDAKLDIDNSLKINHPHSLKKKTMVKSVYGC